MADLNTGGAPVDVGAQPPAPGGAPMPVPASQQSSAPSVGPEQPVRAASARPQAPPPPLTGDNAFLFGPASAAEGGAGNQLNQTGSKIPPPEDAQAWLPWLVQSANMPDASPGLKSLVQLLTYHLSS